LDLLPIVNEVVFRKVNSDDDKEVIRCSSDYFLLSFVNHLANFTINSTPTLA